MSARTRHGTVASIAATGFGLTALCIGSERRYVSPSEARDRVIAALRFLYSRMPTHRASSITGPTYDTASEIWDSEILHRYRDPSYAAFSLCRQHFRYREITRLAYSDLQSCGLDLALRRHKSAASRLDAGSRFPPISLGLLQRTHDDVPAWHRFSTLIRLPVETWHAWKRTYVRIRRAAVHRFLRAALRASVFSVVV